jgi:hypothetical protein
MEENEEVIEMYYNQATGCYEARDLRYWNFLNSELEEAYRSNFIFKECREGSFLSFFVYLGMEYFTGGFHPWIALGVSSAFVYNSFGERRTRRRRAFLFEERKRFILENLGIFNN